VLQVLRRVLGGPARAVMDEVLVQDALQESDIRLDDRLIEVLDEFRQLAFVAGRIAAEGSAADRQQENSDQEEMLHRPTPFRGWDVPPWPGKGKGPKRRAPRSEARSRPGAGQVLGSNVCFR